MRSLRSKLTIFLGVIGLVGILLVILTSWFGARERSTSNAIKNARNISDQIAYNISILSSVGGGDPFSIQRLVEKTATLEDVHIIMVLDQNGIVVAHNDQRRVGGTVISQLVTRAIVEQKEQQQIEGTRLTFVRPLHGKEYTPEFHDVIGVLWLELNLTPSLQRTGQDLWLIIMLSLGGIVLAFVWFFMITKSVVIDRLDTISAGFARVAQGSLETRVRVNQSYGTDDEINRMADQFNQMTSALQNKLEFEEMTASIAARFIRSTPEQLDEAIHQTLDQLGSFFHADRSYIFEFGDKGETMNNTYEWCKDSVEPQIENLQNIPSSAVPWWMEHLRAGIVVSVPCVSDLPEEANNEKELLESQNIRSVLVAPMQSGSGLFGFMGFDLVETERQWTDDDIRLLRITTDILTNTIIRFRSQTELQAQRDFALQVMTSVEQGLVVTDAQSRYEYVNPAFLRMLKYSADQVLGLSPLVFVHPDDHEKMKAELEKRMEGVSSTYSARFIASDQTVVHVLISGSPRVRNERVIGSIGAVTDLTLQLQAEQKLRQSEARNRAFLAAIPDIIFRFDRQGYFLDFNANDQRMLYTSADNIIGRNIRDLLPADVAEKAAEHIHNALETNQPQIFEYQLQSTQGIKTYEARMVASGLEEVLAVMHDISERTRLEQMKTDFVNRASHELRTPLTTAMIMVDLLENSEFQSEENRDFWNVLKQELNRQRNLLDDLLTVGRLESGKYKTNMAPTPILPILEAAVASILPQAQTKKVEIIQEISHDLPHILGSQEPVERILTNLLSNAIKFNRPEGRVLIRAEAGGSVVRLTIKDTGIGIPPIDLPHITSRFFRGTNATEQEIPGSGIGLYIVKTIVEELNGTLEITSEINLGTTISIFLPIAGKPLE